MTESGEAAGIWSAYGATSEDLANANGRSALENVLNVRILNHTDDSANFGGLECFQHTLLFLFQAWKAEREKRRWMRLTHFFKMFVRIYRLTVLKLQSLSFLMARMRLFGVKLFNVLIKETHSFLKVQCKNLSSVRRFNDLGSGMLESKDSAAEAKSRTKNLLHSQRTVSQSFWWKCRSQKQDIFFLYPAGFMWIIYMGMLKEMKKSEREIGDGMELCGRVPGFKEKCWLEVFYRSVYTGSRDANFAEGDLKNWADSAATQ